PTFGGGTREPLPSSAMFGVTLAFAALVLMSDTGAIAADVSPIGAHPKIPFPTSFELPLKISIGLYLVDFSRINGREETFDLQGYLTAKWVDPALASPPGEKNRG